jgi:hypothetical protein
MFFILYQSLFLTPGAREEKPFSYLGRGCKRLKTLFWRMRFNLRLCVRVRCMLNYIQNQVTTASRFVCLISTIQVYSV